MLMNRTQIYIDVPTYERAKALAKASGQTVSELIRSSLSHTVQREANVNPLEQIAALGRRLRFPSKTPNNLSTTIDKYLYRPK